MGSQIPLLLALAAVATGAYAQCMCSASLSPCIESELVNGVCVSKPLGGVCETYHCDISGTIQCSLEESKSCHGGVVVRPNACSNDKDCGEGFACRPNGQCAKYIYFHGMFATDDSGVAYMDGKRIGASTISKAGGFSFKGACGNFVVEAKNNAGASSIAMFLVDKTNGIFYRTGKKHYTVNHKNQELTAVLAKKTEDNDGYNGPQAYDFSSWAVPNEYLGVHSYTGMKFMLEQRKTSEIGTFNFPDWANYTRSTVAYKIELPGC
mmetsp:Transcript_14207/g.35178  ORF Transcript_14207/g.35178 Transcript_14207/m.35178 type:complete len:265 (+) Transcript_14207:61-855(+)